MASVSSTNPENLESRLDQAWIDYVNDNTVKGKFTSEGYVVPIYAYNLRCYSLVKCLDPDAQIWTVQANRDYAKRMHDFISKKCKEDDQFLMDILDFLGNKSSEYIGKLSLWENWAGGILSCDEVFSKSSLLRELKSYSLRPKLLYIISSDSLIRSILAHRLVRAVASAESLGSQMGGAQYKIPLLKYTITFLEVDIAYWIGRCPSVISSVHSNMH